MEILPPAMGLKSNDWAGRTPRQSMFAQRLANRPEMRRTRRWSWCCGGRVPESDPELARWSAAERMREAAASGAELLPQSSALCARSFALKDALLPSPDLLVFAAEAF